MSNYEDTSKHSIDTLTHSYISTTYVALLPVGGNGHKNYECELSLISSTHDWPFYSCVISCQAFDLEWGWR